MWRTLLAAALLHSIAAQGTSSMCGNGRLDAGESCDDGGRNSGDGCDQYCQLEVCGNGIPQPQNGEDCDDGNNNNGDGCNEFCRRECGNGRIDGGESCDDGNLASCDGCSSACQTEACGNGVIDCEEQCDDRNTNPCDGCNPLCRIETCGNNFQECGEECDDGNRYPNDGCNSACRLEAPPSCVDGTQNGQETGIDCGGSCGPCPTCSDGIRNQRETGFDCGGPNCPPCPSCNDNLQNGDESGTDCGGSCAVPCPSCGDGIPNQGEAGVDCGGPFCPPCPSCFDRVLNQGEVGVDCGGPCLACTTCPEAPRIPYSSDLDACAGMQKGSTCRVTCAAGHSALPSDVSCIGPQWSEGTCALNANTCDVPIIPHAADLTHCNLTPSGGTCPLDCSIGYMPTVGGIVCVSGTWALSGVACEQIGSRQQCGDSVVTPPEECDDGNNIQGDGCDANCNVERVCGDGRHTMDEECDDQNRRNGDGCDSNCILERCGNGIVQSPTELCDDGNVIAGDGCSPYCRPEICGNGFLDVDEECDDGNRMSGDGCDGRCKKEVCGNGVTQGNEECDDNNNLNGDGCNAYCMIESCGNGRVDVGEECDDGNRRRNDGCSVDCINEPICGDYEVEKDEECDDGNTEPNDGCSPVCTFERCGSGYLDTGEECDDGNLSGGDGCSANCEFEKCGNGIIDLEVEQCDDGNLVSGDGCSATCVVETEVYSVSTDREGESSVIYANSPVQLTVRGRYLSADDQVKISSGSTCNGNYQTILTPLVSIDHNIATARVSMADPAISKSGELLTVCYRLGYEVPRETSFKKIPSGTFSITDEPFNEKANRCSGYGVKGNDGTCLCEVYWYGIACETFCKGAPFNTSGQGNCQGQCMSDGRCDGTCVGLVGYPGCKTTSTPSLPPPPMAPPTAPTAPSPSTNEDDYFPAIVVLVVLSLCLLVLLALGLPIALCFLASQMKKDRGGSSKETKMSTGDYKEMSSPDAEKASVKPSPRQSDPWSSMNAQSQTNNYTHGHHSYETPQTSQVQFPQYHYDGYRSQQQTHPARLNQKGEDAMMSPYHVQQAGGHAVPANTW